MNRYKLLKITHLQKNSDLGLSDSRGHSTITISFLTYLEKILVYGIIIMVSCIWQKNSVAVKVSSFTHERSPEEGDTSHGGRGPGSFCLVSFFFFFFNLVSLPSFMHSFHFQAQHGYSLQQERAGWRACFLQSRTPPRSLLRHFGLHPMDQNLDTWQHLAIMKVRQYQLHL